MTAARAPSPATHDAFRSSIPALAVVALALLCVGPNALASLCLDGAPALAIVLAAYGLGTLTIPALDPAQTRTPAQRALLSIAVGLGAISLATLALGVAAMLNRTSASAVVIAGVALALRSLVIHKPWRAAEPRARLSPSELALRGVLLLALAPPLAIALLGATLPPGILWPGEAGGYDALEYHLQAPREFFETGRVTFLAHNVYASFPQQMEMQYLLLMHVRGQAWSAAISSQILHALHGVLFVLAIAAWSPPGWPRLAATLIAGTTPWVAYLAPLAYVECGMLFFAAVAAGCAFDCVRNASGAHCGGTRDAVAAGIAAAFACACKYTAVVLVGAGVALLILVAARGAIARRLTLLSAFALAAAAAFAPWAVRNAAFTGNPVYPLAGAVFRSSHWSAEQETQWQAAHRVPADRAALAGRADIAREELFGDVHRGGGASLFGASSIVILLAALALILLQRDRTTTALFLWMSLMLATWTALTHMPGRFVVTLIIPGALAIRTLASASVRSRIGVVTLCTAVALFNDVRLWQEYDARRNAWRNSTSIPLSDMAGMVAAMREYGAWQNRALPPDAFAWLVGDAAVFYIDRRFHYTVVFSRDPWIEAARGLSPADAVADLRRRGVTHVAFNWSEISRLRRTYGFAEIVTPEWVRSLESSGGLTRIEGDEVPRDVALYAVAP